MALPINISDLINGRSVEWDRIEFKRGFNPESILHSICSFANDINNLGGGYIIIGIESKDGQPILPPAGLELNQLDSIQKKLYEICNKLRPNYFPVTQPETFQNKYLFIIWCPGGENRPYRAPKKLNNTSDYKAYVRHGSVTSEAKDSDEQRLLEIAAKIPFDDRINHHSEIEDLNLFLIRSFLDDIGSNLYNESSNIPFNDLCLQMRIARGPSEYLKPQKLSICLTCLIYPLNNILIIFV